MHRAWLGVAVLFVGVLAVTTPSRAVAVADDASFEVPFGTPINGDLSTLVSGFVDPDFSVFSPPAHGTLVVQIETGAFSYTPSPGYDGPDSFVYQAFEDGLPSTFETGTISLTVCPETGCPTAAVPGPASALLLLSGAAGLASLHGLRRRPR